MSNLTYAGIIPNNLPYDTTTELYYGFCGSSSDTTPPMGASFPPNTDYCTETYLNNTIYADFYLSCTGTDSCNFTATSYIETSVV